MFEKLIENNISNKQENELLSYIFEFVPKHFSEIEFDENEEPIVIPSQYPILIFKKRYNDKRIYGKFDYIKYKDAQEIQDSLKAFELDSEKFWFLLLFIHDYCCGACLNTVKANTSSVDVISNLIESIGESMVDISAGRPFFKEETQLNFKTGNKKIKIENPLYLQYLYECCTYGMENTTPKLMHSLDIIDKTKDEANIKLIQFFTKNMLSFLDEHGVTIDKTKDASIYSKKVFISRLIYFTRISKNKEFYDDYSTLKGYLSKCDLSSLNYINKDYL